MCSSICNPSIFLSKRYHKKLKFRHENTPVFRVETSRRHDRGYSEGLLLFFKHLPKIEFQVDDSVPKYNPEIPFAEVINCALVKECVIFQKVYLFIQGLMLVLFYLEINHKRMVCRFQVFESFIKTQYL